MKARVPMLLLAGALTAFGQANFVWDYNNLGISTSNPPAYGSLGWNVTGDNTFANFGQALWTNTVSGTNPNDYELDTTLALTAPGGSYFHLLRVGASNDLTVEVDIPANWQPGGAVPLTIRQGTSSGTTQIGATSLSLHPNDTLRSIVWGTNLWIFVNNLEVGTYTVPLTTGQPGYGAYGLQANSYQNPIPHVRVGHHDTVPPLAPASTTFASSLLPNSVSLKWAATPDDSVGIGVAGYQISRNGTLLTTISEPEYADATVQPSTSYSYSVQAVDFHGNTGPATTIDLTTPPAGSIDPRRIGIYSTGSYWGGGGEQIDTRSGNLHFSVPLLTAQGRTGWTVPVNLIYDSQNWRQDNGVNWQLGNDVGFGFGWKMLIGSITPYYTSNWSGVDHYVYTDGTGAQYRLDQNSNGVWSSLEAVYVWFDANANNLHFADGSFWVMGCTSGGTEPDGGTMYPTIIEDRFGNQVIVTYDVGTSVSSFELGLTVAYNTSSRIVTIDDVRAVAFSGPPYSLPVRRATYSFTYTYPPASGTIPHIAGFSNLIHTPESGTFTVVNSQPQEPPFGSDPNYSGATTSFLSGLTTASLQPYTFSYDSAGAGELASVIFPYGGEISWNYGSFEYLGSRTLREVTGRVVEPDSAHSLTPAWTYGISRPDAPNSVTVHSGMTLTDASGVGAKTWAFNTGGAAWQIGLASRYTQLTAANGAIMQDDYYTWSQDPAGRPYISAKTSIGGEGTGNQQSALTTQTLDQYGNVTQSAIYPYNNTTTPLQTYNNTYVASSTFTPYYIFNLLSTSTVTAGGAPITLASNTYLQYCTWQFPFCGNNVLPSTEYDTNSPVPWGSKAALLSSTTNVRTTTYGYYVYGNVASVTTTDGSTVTASGDSATNYAAPLSISVQSYNQTISYNSWLGMTSQTGANGEQLKMTYDSYGRPLTATSPYGAVTNYSYNTTAPFTQTETGPNGVTTTTVDGFGRPVLVARGDTNGVHSYTATVYAPCACSPLGKQSQVSQPYASGGSASNWTTWTYDGLGRTVSVQQPDGASTTTYAYSGNQTTVTDPTGNWKQFTKDALGNLITVVEPDPCVATNTLTTNYTYNWMNQVTQVSMQRPGISYASNGVCSEIGSPTTQTRTFVYNNAGLLTSATNPENGTVTYVYGYDNTLATKTDAKGQVTRYTYDAVKRLIEIQQFPTGLSNPEDLCGRVFYTWGTDPASYNYGRLVTVQSSPPAYGTNDNGACGWAYLQWAYLEGSGGHLGNPYDEIYNATAYDYVGAITDQFYETYSYTQAGDVGGKALTIARHSLDDTLMACGCSWSSASVGVGYARDSAGRITGTDYLTTAGTATFTTAYDSMGRPVSLTDQNNTQWVSNAQYDFAGRMTNMSYLTGNGSGGTSGVSETRAYNAATGQLASLSWSGAGISGGISYSYSATQNNGQITQAADAVSGETIVYQYDALKRLTSAASTPINGASPTPWTQTFQFDGFGNLTAKVLNGTTNSIAVNAATNQLSNANYDLNGNMTSGAGATITYDETNRMITAQEVSGGIEYYGYGNGNKRMYRVTASGTEQATYYTINGGYYTGIPYGISVTGQEQITLYGAYGEKLGVYGLQSNNCTYEFSCISGVTPLSTSVWFARRLVMDSGNAVVQDRAGTNRASGARFYPYGDEITSTSNDREKFATYTRDSYTGLDYADQRFYANTYGRFDTPDPYQASGGPSSPASWNRYSYTRGDPVNRIDPWGTDDCAAVFADASQPYDSYSPCSGPGGSPCSIGMALAGDPDDVTFLAQAEAMGCSQQYTAPGTITTVAYAPPVPASVEFVSATLLNLNYGLSCPGQPFGAFSTEAFEVLNQYGQPFAVGGLPVTETITNAQITVGGTTYLDSGLNGVFPVNPSNPTTNSAGQFLDTPFGTCGQLVTANSETQVYSVFYNGVWYNLPGFSVAFLSGYQNLSVASSLFGYTVNRYPNPVELPPRLAPHPPLFPPGRHI